MNIKERNIQICLERKKGRTYRDIAKQYGLSPESIRQIYFKKEQEQKEEKDFVLGFLSIRTKNLLIKHFGSKDILNNPSLLANMSREDFFRIKNMGLILTRELVDALRKLGYLDNSEKKLTYCPHCKKPL